MRLRPEEKRRISVAIRGYIAGNEGKPREDCPELGELRQVWLEGWETGRKRKRNGSNATELNDKRGIQGRSPADLPGEHASHTWNPRGVRIIDDGQRQNGIFRPLAIARCSLGFWTERRMS